MPEVIEQTIYFPRRGTRAAEPVPHVMTEADVVRFLRLEKAADPYQTLYGYRRRGWLKAVQVGKHVRYLLPDVLRFLEAAREGNPR